MPAHKNPFISFQWINSSGCDFLQGMVKFSLKDSMTILGWMTVLRNKIYAGDEPPGSVRSEFADFAC